jgi:hypothetical protein
MQRLPRLQHTPIDDDYLAFSGHCRPPCSESDKSRRAVFEGAGGGH